MCYFGHDNPELVDATLCPEPRKGQNHFHCLEISDTTRNLSTGCTKTSLKIYISREETKVTLTFMRLTLSSRIIIRVLQARQI